MNSSDRGKEFTAVIGGATGCGTSVAKLVGVSATVDLPPNTAFAPVQYDSLQGFMAGVAASGLIPFAGHTAAGLVTASSGEAVTGNFAAAPAEKTVFGTPLGDLCKEEGW